HSFPHSARLGLRWWEFDLGYWILVGLSRLGLIWDVRAPAASAVAGKGGKFERAVISARAELDGLVGRLDAAIVEFQQEIDGVELAVLKQRLASRIDAFSATTRDVLIAGLAARRRADEELREALLADVATTIPRDARAERMNAAIIGFRHDALGIDPALMPL